ncbi:MAG: ATP-binding cassette domain-containing protein, partial [Acetobacteraceae bacterium]
MTAVLDIAGLDVRFRSVHAVRGIDLSVERGETHCLVGESGCGKSISALAVMGLLPRGAIRGAARIGFAGTDLARLNERQMATLRGNRIAMIFQ